MKAQKFLMLSCIFGAAIVLASLALLPFDGSPYRYGKPAGLWWVVQFGSGVLLIYAGMGGLMIAKQPERLRGSRPWVGIAALAVLMVLVSVCVVMTLLSTAPTVQSTAIDDVAVLAAVLVTCYAIFAGGLALYYLIWAHRFLNSKN